MQELLLDIRGLRTQFFTDDGLARAVDGVSYSLEKGETVGVVGESGCGKSVTALSVLRLIPDPPGKIVDGRSSLKARTCWSCPRRTCGVFAATTFP